MQLKKDEVKALATKLQVNPDGFKEGVCSRIMDKLNNK